MAYKTKQNITPLNVLSSLSTRSQKKCYYVNKIKSDERIVSLVHVRSSSCIDCGFRLRKISSIGTCL